MEWFFIFIFWIALACVVGGYASKRGRSGGFWMLFSLMFSPLLGFLFVAASPDLAEEQRREAEKRDREKRKKDEKREQEWQRTVDQREQERQRRVELENSKTCPMCAESVKKAAKICRYCGHEFDEETAVHTGSN